MAKVESGKSKTEMAMDALNGRLGKGTIMFLGDAPRMDVKVIETGSIGLDIALGIGGLPKGRIIEVYGMESSGKTTLTLHAIAECQKTGGVAAFIDAEHAFDKKYAEALGVNSKTLIMSQPDCGEDALEVAIKLIETGEVAMVVVDSVAALTPKAEIDGEMGESKMGLHARLMSQAMRKMTGIISKSNCCVIFINQLREKIGVFYGDPTVPTGGNALKFYASVRIEVKKMGASIKDKQGVMIENHIKVKVIKNKMAPPFREAEFDITFGEGISKVGEIVDIGSDLGVLEKSGAWYAYKGQKIAQGREQAKQFFRDNEEMAKELELIIKSQLK